MTLDRLGRRRDNEVMAGTLSWIVDDDRWPTDDGWPYPDGDAPDGSLEEPADPSADEDDDLIWLHTAGSRLLATLDPLVRAVITSHYGLDGREPRSMSELHRELGLSRNELRQALAEGLRQLRAAAGDEPVLR